LLELCERHTFTVETCRQLGTSEFRRIDDAWRVIIADQKVRDQFAQLQNEGHGSYPICMAKTQYGFSTDPNLLGAPKGRRFRSR
jgi:formyltetrahydrofolate synthetase